MKNILITGGAGFIGSHVVRLFVNKYPNYKIINLDKLTYAGNLENLKDIENKPNYKFVKLDICDFNNVLKLIKDENIDGIIHLAAESHVDRSIKDPFTFANTNIIGTLSLLQATKIAWDGNYENTRFHHVSTDEVYGSLELYTKTYFTENTKYDPHSPYSASKASSDHFVKAFHDTYGMNVTISNCSNNYGPNQFPEKLIPLVINNLEKGKTIPVYGNGDNIRDWLYVEDHAKAIDLIFHNGISGETYNIGGMCEKSNIEIIDTVITVYAKLIKKYRLEIGEYIKHIEDRKGHDKRYAIDCSKLMGQLNWKPEETFETGIQKTVKWYLDNQEWMKNVINGDYQKYYNEMYNI